MATEYEREQILKRYSKLPLSDDEKNAIYDCWMRGENFADGQVWVTWTDVMRLILDLWEVRENG